MKAAMIAALALASPAASFVPAAPRADRRIRLGAGLSKTEVDAYVATVKAEVDAVAKARASGSADADAGADAPIAETTVDANGKAAPPTATPSNAKEQLRSLFGRKADPVLACPVSLEPLVTVNRFYGAAGAGMRQCEKFGTTYFSNGAYIDLVPKEASAEPFWQRGLQAVVQTDTFRNPVVAFLYERGWRQGFANAGFPGVDAEFELVSKWFEPAVDKGAAGPAADAQAATKVLDMSCGSGLMTRRIAKSGMADRLLAADFSEVMLLETRRRFQEEKLDLPELLRCDVARLPLQTDALNAVHAGAALHCWPRLDEGLCEIHRVLAPGGRFFATTFKKGAYAGIPAQANDQGGASFRFFDVDELEQLLTDAGFSEVSVELEGRGCLIARCVK